MLIEAHVLQIDLDDTTRCGVNFDALFRVAGARANILSVPSAAVPLPSHSVTPVTPPTPPAMLATLASNDLAAVVELLQTTKDAKTLGSPKLLVLNDQEAHIQVGKTLYYKQITTTETSSQQGAGSVEAGVILHIVPRITRDHRVLLHVVPEVSTPDGEGADGLPPNISKTTLQTDVMLNDNEGMVIGGLINELDQTDQSKIPYLGNLKRIGFLFRRSAVTKKRSEIIVAIVPHIQPYDCVYDAYEQGNLVKTGVPLWHGPLHRNARPWDPVLPDGRRVSVPLVPQRPGICAEDISTAAAQSYLVPPDPLPIQHFDPSVCPTEEELPLGSPTGGFLSNEFAAPHNFENGTGQNPAFINDGQ